MDAVWVTSVEVDLIRHRLEQPLVLSKGTVIHLPEVTVRLGVSNGADHATGLGAVNLSDAWAWPDPEQTSAAKQEAMVDYCHLLADTLLARVGAPAHPLELGMRLHDSALGDDHHQLPALARAVCASAFDAALHDAAGHLTRSSAFAFYTEPAEIPSIDHHFPHGAVAAIGNVLQTPTSTLPGWWLIVPGDDLDRTTDQVTRTGMTRFKIKLSGADPSGDARQVVSMHRAMSQAVASLRLSIDTNEGSSSPEAVSRFLDELEKLSPEAYGAVTYLEQPTARGTLAEHSWAEIGARVPVLVDEALTSMADLETARQQGWSGFAIKTCKGHSFALAAAAWAAIHDLPITVQDLTNIGRSAIHSFLLAAHLPTTNGIELNSVQYLPSANRPWLPRLSGLFAPTNGLHTLDPAGVIGLGSQL